MHRQKAFVTYAHALYMINLQSDHYSRQDSDVLSMRLVLSSGSLWRWFPLCDALTQPWANLFFLNTLMFITNAKDTP